MAISIETLILARRYADKIATESSKEALDKAIKEAVSQSKLYTDEAVSKLVKFQVQIVTSLPTENIDTHTIYFLKREFISEENDDFYYEYMYINNKWELIGTTELDLSDYWTKEEVKQYVDSKEYVLPIASKDTIGGVKVDGISIEIDTDGTISTIDAHTVFIAKQASAEIVGESVSDISSQDISKLFN